MMSKPTPLTVKLFPLTGSNTKPVSLSASLCSASLLGSSIALDRAGGTLRLPQEAIHGAGCRCVGAKSSGSHGHTAPCYSLGPSGVAAGATALRCARSFGRPSGVALAPRPRRHEDLREADQFLAPAQNHEPVELTL
jgi:hypothetical protein